MRAWIARRTNTELRSGLCWARTIRDAVSLLLMLSALMTAAIAVVIVGGFGLAYARGSESEGLAVWTAQGVLVALCMAGLGAVLWSAVNVGATFLHQLFGVIGGRNHDTN